MRKIIIGNLISYVIWVVVVAATFIGIGAISTKEKSNGIPGK